MTSSAASQPPGERLARLAAEIRACGRLEIFDTQGRVVAFRVDGLTVELREPLASLVTTPACSGRAAVGSVDYDQGDLEDLEALLFATPCAGLEAAEAPAMDTASGITLMVVQGCNLSCRYCFGEAGTYGTKTRWMSGATARHAIDMMLARSPEIARYYVTFFGGEPLLALPLIRETVQRCGEITGATGKIFRFSITTNATLVDDPTAEFLRENCFSVMVSLDGPKEAHDRYRVDRRGRGSFERTVRGTRRLVGAGVRPELRATLTSGRAHLQAIRELLKLARTLGACRLVVSPVSPVTGGGSDMTLGVEEHRALAHAYGALARENLDNILRGGEERPLLDPNMALLRLLARGRTSPPRCGACYGMSAIATDGSIFPCHRFVGEGAYRIGHIDTGFDTKRIRRFVSEADEARRSTCTACWARGLCGGTCPRSRADGDGSFTGPPLAVCEGFRTQLRSVVECLAELGAAPPERARAYLAIAQQHS
jgi:uncharacterized protein